MPWVPSTDFEEEIINLQPDHDFIYGGLSEPEPMPLYPRPKAHIEYAFKQKKEAKKQQELYETTGRMNEKLHVISQVQRIAGTKPLGEQPTMHDWDCNQNVEKETVGMMRYCGLGPSLEEPLDDKVTIATFPVEKNIRIVKNGRKKVPVFFDENVFKLKPKISNSSSGFDSSGATSSNNVSDAKDDSILSQSSQSNDTSFNTTASSLNNSDTFYTGELPHSQDSSNTSMTPYKKAQIERESLLLKAERMRQYDKLLEETASLSLSDHLPQNDSFKTAKDYNEWTGPCEDYDEDGNINIKAMNFPPLKYNEYKPSKKWHNVNSSMSASSSVSSSTNNSTIETSFGDYGDSFTGDETSSAASSTRLSKNFLERFITDASESFQNTSDSEVSSTTTSSKSSKPSTSKSSISQPSSYADMAKISAVTSPASKGAKPKSGKKTQQQLLPKFYTAREIYDMKRRVQQ